MKKFISLFLCLLIMFSISIPVFAADSQPIDVKLCNYINPQGKWVKEKYIHFDVEPEIYYDRTYVPVRAIAEELGYKVDWRNGKVILYKKLDSDFEVNKNNQNLRTLNLLYRVEAGKKVDNILASSYYRIGGRVQRLNGQTSIGTILTKKPALGVDMYVSNSIDNKENMRSVVYIVSNNGGSGGEGISISHKFDCPAIIVEGRTLIPLRALGELLGLDVSWDGNKYLVTISA